MKQWIVSTLAIAIGVSAGCVFASDGTVLAERHAKMGVTCVQCHKTQTPKEGAKVKNESCFACHQSYEALAQKTARLDPNPHKTHLGNVRCSDCHLGHEKSRLMCNDCHKFNLSVK